MEETIDPKMQQLADAVNAPEEVQVIWAYEGHYSSTVSPFVKFDAPLHVARSMAMCLRTAWFGKKLTYWWEIVGKFEADASLRFELRSPRLGRERGLLARIQDHVLSRNLIDRDLSVLADEINSLHQAHGISTAFEAVGAATQQATSRKAFVQRTKELRRERPDTAEPFRPASCDGDQQ